MIAEVMGGQVTGSLMGELQAPVVGAALGPVRDGGWQ